MLTRFAVRGRERSGITLTEILISIMIMGIGVISLATLFPLGLLRLRQAQRLTRGAYLVQAASSDLASRNLLAPRSFTNPSFSPWYNNPSGRYDPWVQDTPGYGVAWGATYPWAGVFRGFGGNGGLEWGAVPAEPGLPVAYDPLWRAVTGKYPVPINPPANDDGEARFGSGIGFIRPDPGGGAASVHGLQRITNFATVADPIFVNAVSAAEKYRQVIGAFVSPEDVVLQESTGTYTDPNNGGTLASPSTIVPDLSMNGGSPLLLPSGVVLYSSQNDWRFTWMFTGQRSAAGNGSNYDGNIVIHENRQFSHDPVEAPIGGGTVYQPGGETVVEAVWGYSAAPGPADEAGNAPGQYGSLAARRSVLLRWPSTLPDPDVKVGTWIADVTYERASATQIARAGAFPLQRCYWYRVAKKTEPTVGRGFPSDPNNVSYREMTVWVGTKLRAATPIDFANNEPRHVEAALIAPTVVNVYPWSGIVR